MTVCVGDPFLLEIQALILTSINSNNTTALRASIRLWSAKIVGDPFVHEIQDLTQTASIVTWSSIVTKHRVAPHIGLAAL